MTSREPDTHAIVTWTANELKRFDDLVDDHYSAKPPVIEDNEGEGE